MGITHLTKGEQRSYDQPFLKYGNFVTEALSGVIWRFYRKRVLISNFTRQIRNQDHQIDQKKFVSLITSDVDTYLTLPLDYTPEKAIRKADEEVKPLIDVYQNIADAVNSWAGRILDSESLRERAPSFN